ncbi:MAG: hypothetical protein E6Q97_23180 [Desulfurellales bacterium]|nr:MAG: hypothetical protein E6Q97_23180 [Desulfurellales bacterium]
MAIDDAWLLTVRTQAINNRGVAVTYKAFSSGVPNLKTGATNATFTTTAISKCLVSGIKKGDQGSFRLFQFLASAVSSTRPNKKDEIVYDGETYIVFDLTTDQHEQVYQVKAMKP